MVKLDFGNVTEMIFFSQNEIMFYVFQSIENIILSYNICFIAILFSALAIIFSFNPVYSVIFLILCFLETSFLFILFQIEFIALILVIVYLGAVCVLFLFIIMMLNIKILELRREINFIPFSFFFISFFFLSNTFFYDSFIDLRNMDILIKLYDMFFFYNTLHHNKTDIVFPIIESSNTLYSDSIKRIGFVLYTFFSSHFIIASFVLLVAMIGAIFLTLEITSKSKKQDLFFQLTRNKGGFY